MGAFPAGRGFSTVFLLPKPAPFCLKWLLLTEDFALDSSWCIIPQWLINEAPQVSESIFGSCILSRQVRMVT
jgi:hypothetical protein